MATMMLVVLVTMALDTLCKLSPHKHTLSHYQQPAPEPPATSRSPERRKNPIFSGRGEAGAASGAAQYSGPVDVARSLYREGGLRSVFKGSAATAARGRSLI